eukprot:TRINITY_DN6848_c0_g1_i6.p1 TRINITY_DN6848_c0_g1~~TRINITY_DN6848_c0_g1_i6.p1  ORF type:complete len:344 (-),score=85.83 TRINITY_DN6848_c0_g1_i6:254-1285(-)
MKNHNSTRSRLIVVCVVIYALALIAGVVTRQVDDVKQNSAFGRGGNGIEAMRINNITVPDEELSSLEADFNETQPVDPETQSPPTSTRVQTLAQQIFTPSEVKPENNEEMTPSFRPTPKPGEEQPPLQTDKPTPQFNETQTFSQSATPSTAKTPTAKPETAKPPTATPSRTKSPTATPSRIMSPTEKPSRTMSPTEVPETEVPETETPETAKPQTPSQSPRQTFTRKSRRSKTQTQSIAQSPSAKKSASVLRSRSMSAVSDYVDADQSSGPSLIFPVVMIGACFGGCYYFGKKYNIIGSDSNSNAAPGSTRTSRPARHSRTRRGADYELEPLNQDDDYEDSFA